MIKYSSPLTIQYIFISDKKSFIDNDFFVSGFNLMRELPVEIIQLENSIKHFEFSFTFKAAKGYEIFAIPSLVFTTQPEESVQNILEYSKFFSVNSLVKIFLVDKSISNFDNVIETLKNRDLFFFKIFDSHEVLANNQFGNAKQLLNQLKSKIETIKKKLSDYYIQGGEMGIDTDLKFEINPRRTFIIENSDPGSMVEMNNFFILNQIIGNNWLEVNNQTQKDLTIPSDRSEKVIEKAKKIDRISEIMYRHVGVQTTDPFQPYLSTLVLVAPYHYPKFESLHSLKPTKEQKRWLAILNSEQDLNYQHYIESGSDDVSPEAMAIIMKKNLLRINFLDNAAFFHAMFSYSPVIRLPQIGKSINKELSHLQKAAPKKQSTLNNIKRFGEKLANLTVSDSLKDYIAKRNGQIFCISDLPIEWLYLNNLPLSLTHDVCRLPEFNLNSLINNAIHLQRGLYEIPNDLINRTLILHCASQGDAALNEMFDLIDSYQTSLGFKAARCSSIEQVKFAINSYKPDLLIFDCHGTSNPKELSSFLFLDQENGIALTGDDIVQHKISAPLVFLSACETFPNYGYVKLLSDAFMESGAHCVTTTFFPIKITDATSLIIRLLNNLRQLSTNTYHSNWLHFISHMLRSTYIFETIRKSSDQFKNEISEEKIAELLTKFMHFETRNQALVELNDLVENNSRKKISFSDLDNEWLSYSTIGRADLIYFKSWLDDFRRLNIKTAPNSG